jgi:hypothetical protein
MAATTAPAMIPALDLDDKPFDAARELVTGGTAGLVGEAEAVKGALELALLVAAELKELGLEPGFELELELGLEPGLELGLEPGLELGLEPGLEPGLELGIKLGLNVGIELEPAPASGVVAVIVEPGGDGVGLSTADVAIKAA